MSIKPLKIAKRKNLYFGTEPPVPTPYDDLPADQKDVIEHMRLLLNNDVYFTYAKIGREFNIGRRTVRKLAIRHLNQPLKRPTATGFILDFIIKHGRDPTVKEVQKNSPVPMNEKSIASSICMVKKSLNIDPDNMQILNKGECHMTEIEIAKALGLSQSTIQRTIHSALSKMKEYMDSQGLSTDDFEFTTIVRSNIQ